MTQPRKRIGLLFGGRSAEHEVSQLSAANILRALDPDRYDIVPIGIGRDGRWLLCDNGNGGGRGAQALAAWGAGFAYYPLLLGHLLLTASLPASANGSAYQGKASTLSLVFDGVQRAGAGR